MQFELWDWVGGDTNNNKIFGRMRSEINTIMLCLSENCGFFLVRSVFVCLWLLTVTISGKIYSDNLKCLVYCYVMNENSYFSFISFFLSIFILCNVCKQRTKNNF